jgi:hypothetical protein
MRSFEVSRDSASLIKSYFHCDVDKLELTEERDLLEQSRHFNYVENSSMETFTALVLARPRHIHSTYNNVVRQNDEQ